jgi:hypothetical protein
VVLASRVDPPLSLARLRVRGQLTELRARDLRFTQDETAALLGEVAGLDLPTASLAALSARTEGWVAGLQLAALSLQRDVDPAGFVASFSGSHRFVLDYLTEEVLARQPEELVRFLLGDPLRPGDGRGQGRSRPDHQHVRAGPGPAGLQTHGPPAGRVPHRPGHGQRGQEGRRGHRHRA